MISIASFLFFAFLCNNCFVEAFTKQPFSHTIYTNKQTEIYSTMPGSTGSRKPVIPPPPINQYIKADPVRLLIPGEDNADNDVMVGVLSLAEALEYAEKLQVDLVMINDKGDPPVCKAIDYGKYKYSLEKKKKENAKKQVQSEIKEVKMSYKIEQHDFDVRVRAIQKFLNDGDRVS